MASVINCELTHCEALFRFVSTLKHLFCCLNEKLKSCESLLPVNYNSFFYLTSIAFLLLKNDSSHEVRSYFIVLFLVENA